MNVIVFRVDASHEIGVGHVMRCLALAEELNQYAFRIIFICRLHKGHLADLIKDKGYQVFILPITQQSKLIKDNNDDYGSWLGCSWKQDAIECKDLLAKHQLFPTFLVVDHYGIDARWHSMMRLSTKNIVVIDDLANRSYDCDLLIDQNLSADLLSYKSASKSKAKYLLGPKYALLRKQFYLLRNRIQALGPDRWPLKNCLVCLGGYDIEGWTSHIMGVLLTAQRRLIFHVIIPGDSHQRSYLELLSKQYSNMRLYFSPLDLSELMLLADFAIGTAGTMSWERACIGLPTLLYQSAENQKQSYHFLAKSKAVIPLGALSSNGVGSINDEIHKLTLNQNLFLKMVERNYQLCDGLGCQRVARIIREVSCCDEVSIR